MTKRGRPPRPDNRTAERIYGMFSKTELAFVKKELTTDEVRMALVGFTAMRRLAQEGDPVAKGFIDITHELV